MFDLKHLISGLFKLGADFGRLQMDSLRTRRQIRWTHFASNRKALQATADLMQFGFLQPTVEKVFNFDQLPQAFEAVLAGHSRGRIVLRH